MASSKTEDGHKLLEKFRAVWAVDGELYDLAQDMLKGVPDDLPNKKAAFTSLIGQLRCMHSIAEEIHHTIGHAWFNACWATTNVGHEFDIESGSLEKSVLEELAAGGVHMQVLDPNNLPENLPEELKELVKQHEHAHQQASKAHLH